MYPQRELNRLAAYKVALRRDISLRRIRCAEAASRVTQPLEWLDRMLAFLRRFSQFTAVPLGLLFTSALFPRMKVLGSLARWSPLVFGAVRGIGSAVKSCFGSSKSSKVRS
jgi:hypothetical protein